MIKMIWLAEPQRFQPHQLSFPAMMAKEAKSHLTVVDTSAWRSNPVPVYINDPVFPTTNYTIPDIIPPGKEHDAESFRKSLETTAQEAGIEVEFVDGSQAYVDNLADLSRFADLIMVNTSLALSPGDDHNPTDFVMSLLPKMQCPVLLLPDDQQEIKELIFTYNGGYSSMYSIRQFAQLFPGFRNLPVTILYVEENEHSIPYERELKNWLAAHYDNYSFKLLRGEPSSALMTELMWRKNVLVTFGAFGRSKLSRFFKGSNAEGVLQVIDIPVFITHP